MKLIERVNRKIGSLLRKKYGALTVTRPYVIQVDEHKELKGKVAIITGGSGAIGRACAVRLAAEGAKVYICGSHPGSAQPVADEIKSYGLLAEPTVLNVLDNEAIEKIVHLIAAENNDHIDILVNSAGGSARDHARKVAEQSVEVIDNVLNINLRGAILCSRAVAPYMIAQKSGRIINITSVIGLQGKAGYSEYAASKGGSIAFIKSLAQELGRFNITVNGVAPGIVQRGEVTEDMKQSLTRTNWMGTYGKPEDISAVVNFLCKEEASFITGQNIAVDGGRSLGLKES